MQVRSITPSYTNQNYKNNNTSFGKLEKCYIEGLIKKVPTEEAEKLIKTFSDSEIVKNFCNKYQTKAFFTTFNKNMNVYECHYGVLYRPYPKSNNFLDRLKAAFTSYKTIDVFGLDNFERKAAENRAIENMNVFESNLKYYDSMLENLEKEKNDKALEKASEKAAKIRQKIETKKHAQNINNILNRIM